MKRSEVEAIFPDATKEQIDEILDAMGKEINPLKSKLEKAEEKSSTFEEKFKKATEENEGFEDKLKELTQKLQEGMSAEEKLEALQKEMEDKAEEFQIKSNTLDAKTILSEGGLSAEEIEALIPQIVTTDTEATNNLAKSFVDVIGKQKESIIEQTKADILKGNPTLGGAGGSQSLTKEAFDKLTYSEQIEILENNPELIKGFSTSPNVYQM